MIITLSLLVSLVLWLPAGFPYEVLAGREAAFVPGICELFPAWPGCW